ncbi:extracellular solute-binding protein [Consotaella aegiceratis]|uniref:extracellular solute-binding protein n=1 Tax=Consotaella aegiceratis TaxID=3097961 RepID=UPI002F3E7D00
MGQSKRRAAIAALGAVLLSASASSVYAANLSMWARDSGASIIQRVVDLWNKENPDDPVELTVIPADEMVTKFATAATAGQVPDLLSLDLIFAPPFMRAGFFEDVTDMVGTDPNYENTVKALRDLGTYEDRIYGVPFTPENSILIYNKDLFDEPLSNLDAKLRVQMRLELAKLHQELETTMIYVTHDQVEAMTLADRIVVMDSGRISQVGSPLDLYHHPANKFVAAFIGSPGMNFLPAEPTRGEGATPAVQLRGTPGTLPLRGRPATVPAGLLEAGIRPEDVTLAEPGSAGTVLTGAVELVERLGNSTIVYVATDLGQVVKQGDGNLQVKLGQPVGIGWDPARMHVFDAAGQAI